MTTTPPYHPHIRFRFRLARHALTQFAASLGSSLTILLILAGPADVALWLPALPLALAYAASWPNRSGWRASASC